MSTPLSWFFYSRFDAIPARHLFEILRLRQQVFIIEQDCIYEDIDSLDPLSEHLLITQKGDQMTASTEGQLGSKKQHRVKGQIQSKVHSQRLAPSQTRSDEKPLATLRIVPAGAKFEEVSIGRIVVRENARNLGLGETMVRNTLARLQTRGEKTVKIEAQHHLANWYGTMGFETCGSVFDLDGIPHVQMICSLKSVQPMIEEPNGKD
jgi:ElaA protein